MEEWLHKPTGLKCGRGRWKGVSSEDLYLLCEVEVDATCSEDWRMGRSWRIDDSEKSIESLLWRIGKRTDKNSIVFLGSVSCPVKDAEHEYIMKTVGPVAFSATILSKL